MSRLRGAALAAFFLAASAVLVLSLLPAPLLPPVFDWWDKAQHATGFLVLAMLGAFAWPGAILRVSVALLAYGGAIEVAQGLTGWRHAELTDFVADSLGVLTGAVVHHLAWRRRPCR